PLRDVPDVPRRPHRTAAQLRLLRAVVTAAARPYCGARDRPDSPPPTIPPCSSGHPASHRLPRMTARKHWLPRPPLPGALMPAQANEQPPAATPTAKQDYEALIKEYGAAQRALVDKYQKEVEQAKAAGATTMPAFDMDALAAEWVPRFQAGADKFRGSD